MWLIEYIALFSIEDMLKKKEITNSLYLLFFPSFFFTQDSIFFVIKNHSWTVYNHFSQLGSDTAPCDPVKDKQLSNMHS